MPHVMGAQLNGKSETSGSTFQPERRTESLQLHSAAQLACRSTIEVKHHQAEAAE
jgi:hypothetical protein